MSNLPRIVKKALADVIREEGLLKDDILSQAQQQIRQTGLPVHRVFHRMGVLTETDLARCVSRQLGLPLLDASGYQVPKELVGLVDFAILDQHQMVPIDRIGKVLVVAASGPPPTEAVDALEKAAGGPAFFVISAPTQIDACLTKYYRNGPAKAVPAAAAAPAPAKP